MITIPRKILIHPFLIALYAVLSFWEINKKFIALGEIWRAVSVSLIAAGFIYLVFWLILRNHDKSALLSTVIVIAVLYFGHLYSLVDGVESAIIANLSFIILWSLFLVISLYSVIRFCKKCDQINAYLNSVSLILIVFPLFQIVQASLAHEKLTQQTTVNADSAAVSPQNIEEQNQPDIYYIILDAYGRADILSQMYSFDNSPFLDSLKQRGFYIAEQSVSNYIQTNLSLSSSLTVNYLDSAYFDPASEDRTITRNYLNQSPLFQQFHQSGYQIVALDDFFDELKIDAADETVSYDQLMNNFEYGFYNTTLLGRLAPLYDLAKWEVTRSQLDILEEFPTASETPRLIFAHLLMPHPSFVFDKDGNFVSRNNDYADGSNYKGTREEYISGYIDQVQYLNFRMIKIIDHILTGADRPVVIILQGDHGPGAYLDWENLENTCLNERFSIFNAYYFSNKEAQSKLYPAISPVNSFRVVFDQLLNQPMPLLDDRSYFSTWSKPYNFTDVTDSKNSCSPIK